MGSSVAGSRCRTRPIDRFKRIAAWAAAIERWRPRVTGSTVPGNRTRLRVWTRISASDGKAGIPASACSMAPDGGAAADSAARSSRSSRGIAKFLSKWRDAGGVRASQLMQLHHQTSVGQVSPRNLEPGWRQFDPPLKMAMRDLQPMYPRFRQFRRQWALAADQQHSGAQRDLNQTHFDTGQGNQDRQGV